MYSEKGLHNTMNSKKCFNTTVHSKNGLNKLKLFYIEFCPNPNTKMGLQ